PVPQELAGVATMRDPSCCVSTRRAKADAFTPQEVGEPRPPETFISLVSESPTIGRVRIHRLALGDTSRVLPASTEFGLTTGLDW
ncbi:hypothetical protein OY671_008134, partial [Metschnikowia pulcherrima]